MSVHNGANRRFLLDFARMRVYIHFQYFPVFPPFQGFPDNDTNNRRLTMDQGKSKEHFIALCECIMNRYFSGKELSVLDAAFAKNKVANAALLGWDACLKSKTYAEARKAAYKIASEYFDNDPHIKSALLDAIELKWREFRDDNEHFEAVKVTEIDGKTRIVICKEDEVQFDVPTGKLLKTAAKLKSSSERIDKALKFIDNISLKPMEMTDFWRIAASILDYPVLMKDKFQDFVYCKDNMLAAFGRGGFVYCELPKSYTNYPDGTYGIVVTGRGYAGIYLDELSKEYLSEVFSHVEAVRKKFSTFRMKGFFMLTRDMFLDNLQAECEKHFKEADENTVCTIDDGYILALLQVANKFKLKMKVGNLNKEPTLFAKGLMDNDATFYFVAPVMITSLEDDEE